MAPLHTVTWPATIFGCRSATSCIFAPWRRHMVAVLVGRCPGCCHMPDPSAWMQVLPAMKKLVAEVRTTYGVKSVGCEGFCWGGHYTTFLLGPHTADFSSILCILMIHQWA